MINHVLRNLSRFREGISILGEHKSYKVLLDAETGEMKFPQKIREISSFKGKKSQANWQEVHLVKHQSHYEIQGAEIQKMIAQKVVEKTLEKLNADQQRKEIEKLPGWSGHLTAIQAEEKLRGQRRGTYLIRSFNDVSNMIDTMKQEYDCEILSYVIVIAMDEKKFSEILLLNVPWGWLVFQDEPNLRAYAVYQTPKKVIESLEFAKTPL
ncbi:MAG TPA: hypothetical protein VLE96_06675 [Chlamydiales bacterium]|nr:hypothetical protein [Chlamydiales bacterium]